MAIKNPNPNIKDFEVNDNTTWSSNHIAAGLEAAGVEVSNDGSIEPVKAQILKEITTTEDLATIEIKDLNVKALMIEINLTYTSAVSGTIYVAAKTDADPDNYKRTAAYNTRSFTANSLYYLYLMLDCSNGIITGSGYSNVTNSYASPQSGIPEGSLLVKNIKDIEIRTSTAFPTGTVIKVYGI